MLPDGKLKVQPALPAAGGYLEQDAELMWAFDVLESTLEEIEQGRAAREEAKERLKQLQGGTFGAIPQQLLTSPR